AGAQMTTVPTDTRDAATSHTATHDASTSTGETGSSSASTGSSAAKDAGKSTPKPDAGTGSDAQDGHADDSGGCSVGHNANPLASGLLWLLGVASCLVVRRRRSA
ncbi:MAG: hypothetical protein JWN48_6045, partial [Myxococcaceae bacterium]|nr:hypothetical protein [Myxococcaceae bacterium]